MPNWCSNSVVLTHKDPSMIDRARQAFTEGRLLAEFIPIPEELQITAGFLGNGEEQKKLEEAEQRNQAVCGYKNWYDFCVNEWGTKWDIGNDGDLQDVDNGLMLNFESAWSPPIEAYGKLVDLGFDVEALYYEPGIAFCGEYTTEAGECTYQIEGNSDWVEENIPEHIDEAFAISATMSEWEEEAE